MMINLVILSMLGLFSKVTGYPLLWAFAYSYIVFVSGVLNGHNYDSQFSVTWPLFLFGCVLFWCLNRVRHTFFTWWVLLFSSVIGLEIIWGFGNLIW